MFDKDSAMEYIKSTGTEEKLQAPERTREAIKTVVGSAFCCNRPTFENEQE